MTEKKKNIPELRFPEFEGEWISKKINEIGEVITGSTPDTTVKEYYGGKKLFVSPCDISNSRYIERTNTTLTILGFEKGRIIKPLSVLFVCIGSTIGKIAQNKFECVTNQQINAVMPFNGYNPDFLFSILEKYSKKIQMLSATQAVPIINKTTFSKIKLPFTIIDEQQKIASFLTSVDERIQQLTKKKELLEKYKKGIMQKIFSQQIRFKDDDGKDFPDWEIKSLKNIASIYDGTHMTPDYQEQGVPFYSVEHVTANQFSESKFISEEVFEKENKRVILEKGDILMTRIGDIGTSKYIDWDIRASFYVSLALLKKKSSINMRFLDQFIKTSFFQKELYKRTIHVAFPKKINLGEIGECELIYPVIEEQQKIADFLSSIDKKIESVEKQLEKTKAFKKGLLQKMFV